MCENEQHVRFRRVMALFISAMALQGLVGTIPWSAFSFNTMFFQYCNMSDVEAAFITGGLLIGAAVGGVAGGLLGDRLFQWSPFHGRPLVGKRSAFRD